MIHRFLRTLWPLGVLVLVFALRASGCKSNKENPKMPDNVPPKWQTIMRPVATPHPQPTIPQGVKLVPTDAG